MVVDSFLVYLIPSTISIFTQSNTSLKHNITSPKLSIRFKRRKLSGSHSFSLTHTHTVTPAYTEDEAAEKADPSRFDMGAAAAAQGQGVSSGNQRHGGACSPPRNR